MKTVRYVSICLVLVLIGSPLWACPFCNSEAKQAIYNSQFYPNLAKMLSAFFVLALLVAALSIVAAKRHQNAVAKFSGKQPPTPVPLFTTAVVLGIGVGGFIDGIVLHQILQWHGMLSNKVSLTNSLGKTVNMFWDGIFHAFTLLVTLVGIVLLWRLLRRPETHRSGYLLSGGMLVGWGIFNLVEGVIDHHLLKLHNVREVTKNPAAWNAGFLIFSVLILLLGYLLQRRAAA